MSDERRILSGMFLIGKCFNGCGKSAFACFRSKRIGGLRYLYSLSLSSLAAFFFLLLSIDRSLIFCVVSCYHREFFPCFGKHISKAVGPGL